MMCFNAESVRDSRRRARSLLFGLAVSALALGQRCVPIQPQACVPELADDDHVLAVGRPAVTVFEYANFECSHCGKFARETWPTLRQEYVDTGKVRWIARHRPFRSAYAPVGVAAQASECAADQGAFWEYRELVYANQADLSVAALKSYAVELALDTQAFDACLDGQVKAAEIDAERAAAEALGVCCTPYFFVDGRPFAGFRTVEEFRTILDAALAAAGAD